MSMSNIKEILKNSKSIKKSDEILDDLFNSIKEESKAPSEEEDSSEAEKNTDDSDDDGVEEKKKKKKGKKKKKEKKLKKKKKKHKRDDRSEERKETIVKKKKSSAKSEDGFWGDSKPFELDESRKVDQSRRETSRGEEKRERKAPKEGDKSETGRYERSEPSYYDRRPHIEYDDERRPVDLGRVARPVPVDLGREARPYPTGEMREARPYPTGGEREARPYPTERVGYTGYDQSYEKPEPYYRGTYEREQWVRGEYDRYGRGAGERREERRPREEERRSRPREEYSRPREKGEGRGKDKDKVKETVKKEGEKEGADGFWDTKWDAMQLDERLEKAEKKGRYYLNTKKRFQDATGDKEGTPSLSPSPSRKGKENDSSEESDTEELKRMKKMKDIVNLKVDGDGMVVGPVADSANFVYDKVTRMFKKKDGMVEMEKKKMDGDKNEINKLSAPKERLALPAPESEEMESTSTKLEKEDPAQSEDKDEVMDELVKEIEELENEVEKQENNKDSSITEKATSSIDWGNSALAHLKDEETEKEKKLEDGEVEEEDGEISSEEEKGEKGKSKKRRRSKSRSTRRSYSREKKRGSYDRSVRRRSRSHDRSSYSRRRSRSPYDRRERGRYERRSRSRGRRSKSRGKYDRRSRSRSKSRGRYDRRSRSGSRERAEDRYERNKRRQEKHMRSKVNKEKLLEIAKKNAAKILKSGGDLMGMDQDRLIAMKSGGQSLDELTKFCKEIAKKGLEDSNRIDLLAESESSDEEEFHHPFMVKDRPLPNPITMLIGEARETLPPAARAVAKSQRMLEFPVSSGNAHRSKEPEPGQDPLGDWQPVEKKAAEVMKKDEDEMVKFHEQMEKEEKELKEAAASKTVPAINTETAIATEEVKPWSLSEADKEIAIPKSDMFKLPIKELPPDKQAELERLKPKSQLALAAPTERLALPAPSTSVSVAEPIVSTDPNKVFDTAKAPVVDIGTIVSQRLNAMRKLQANPTDAEALQEMYEAQKLMTTWASSKNKPGQFVGSTGAKILSRHELNLGLQCWAKSDQFLKAERVKGGFGEFMLKKMGWADGEGLGKHKSGDVNPLTLDIKFDKKGLMAAEEDKTKVARSGGVVTMTACKDLSGKHPVSALTELCSKRRWGPPIFTQAFECGPPHKKQYIFKVNVNGTDYSATVAVDNKKKAKANAAMSCLQILGLVPKDPDNPV